MEKYLVPQQEVELHFRVEGWLRGADPRQHTFTPRRPSAHLLTPRSLRSTLAASCPTLGAAFRQVPPSHTLTHPPTCQPAPGSRCSPSRRGLLSRKTSRAARPQPPNGRAASPPAPSPLPSSSSSSGAFPAASRSGPALGSGAASAPALPGRRAAPRRGRRWLRAAAAGLTLPGRPRHRRAVTHSPLWRAEARRGRAGPGEPAGPPAAV